MIDKPLFTLITPTIQRQSLLRCCDSVNANDPVLWQHIVQIDSAKADESLLERCAHSQRTFRLCGLRHNNYGNTCRHLAWERATGEFLVMLDDDNYLADEHILRDIAALPQNMLMPPDWLLFPIMRHGQRFFNDPPGLCRTDTANVVVRREVGRWPNIPEYTADGIWVEGLKQYPYEAYPNFRPIVIMEKSNEGRADA